MNIKKLVQEEVRKELSHLNLEINPLKIGMEVIKFIGGRVNSVPNKILIEIGEMVIETENEVHEYSRHGSKVAIPIEYFLRNVTQYTDIDLNPTRFGRGYVLSDGLIVNGVDNWEWVVTE